MLVDLQEDLDGKGPFTFIINMKILIFSSPKSGNHFLARSLSKTFQVPYIIPYDKEDYIDFLYKNNYILCVHNFYNNEIKDSLKKQNIICMGIERNILDHLVSFNLHKNNTSSEYVKISKTKNFKIYRELMFSIPYEKRFSYDLLLNNDEQEHKRLSNYLDIPGKIKIENIKESYPHVGLHANVGRTGNWTKYINLKDAIKICDIYNESYDIIYREEKWQTLQL